MSYQKGNACILHEDQKEIKDIGILEVRTIQILITKCTNNSFFFKFLFANRMNYLKKEDYVTNDKMEEPSLAVTSNNFMDVDETVSLEIDNVDTEPLQLFGLDQFNQLDNR